MGVPGHDTEVTDYSPETTAAQGALRREILQRLSAAPVTGDRDRVAKEAMEDVLTLREELIEAGDHLRLSGFRNAVTSMRQVFDIMPRASRDDWATIAERMSKLGPAAESYRRTLEEGLRKAVPTARRQAAQAIRQI
jgi:hypothetical protein